MSAPNTFAMRHHFSREKVGDHTVKLDFVPSADNLADMLTKALPQPALERPKEQMGISKYPITCAMGGVSMWRLHLVIPGQCFILFPLSTTFQLVLLLDTLLSFTSIFHVSITSTSMSFIIIPHGCLTLPSNQIITFSASRAPRLYCARWTMMQQIRPKRYGPTFNVARLWMGRM
jgi:hypothetical protein